MRRARLATPRVVMTEQVVTKPRLPSIEQIPIRRISPPKRDLAHGGAFTLRQAFHFVMWRPRLCWCLLLRDTCRGADESLPDALRKLRRQRSRNRQQHSLGRHITK